MLLSSNTPFLLIENTRLYLVVPFVSTSVRRQPHRSGAQVTLYAPAGGTCAPCLHLIGHLSGVTKGINFISQPFFARSFASIAFLEHFFNGAAAGSAGVAAAAAGGEAGAAGAVASGDPVASYETDAISIRACSGFCLASM